MSTEGMANPPTHLSMSHLRTNLLHIPRLAASRKPRLRPWTAIGGGRLIYPLPNYQMWRGNHLKYTYNTSTASTWGEGETKHIYHQHYAHAKDVSDYGRAGREFQFLNVTKGKLQMKPLPKVQYVVEGSKPKWLWKSWHGALNSSDMWQREVQYDEHVPQHIGAKRPLAVLSPSTFHQHLHLMHMEKITVTVSPLMVGYGQTLLKSVLDFYRRALSSRSPFPRDKIFLFYSIDIMTPQIEVTWLDGTTYAPPLVEGCRPHDIIQMVMEQAWLAQDRMEAAGRVLQPLAIDDYKWEQLITFKKIRDKEAAKAKGGKK